MAIEAAPDIEKVIRESYDAYQRGDASTLDEGWSRDESVIVLGTAPGERWEGHRTIVEGMGKEMAERTAESPQSRMDAVRAYREGDVGWAVTEGAFVIDGAGIPTRGTAVLHREDGSWKFVQWTFSVLVPDPVLEPGSPLLETVASRR
jgi:ketosteroid isomerase-like protein